MSDVTAESRKFWTDIEKEKGGAVEFYTFATFLGKSRGKSVRLGGLLYIVDRKVYFEDFEKDNWFFKIMSRNKKYEKTEFHFDIDLVDEVKITTRGSSLNCISGLLDDGKTRTLGGIARLFFQPVVQLFLKDGYSFFFEIMKQRDFLQKISGLR